MNAENYSAEFIGAQDCSVNLFKVMSAVRHRAPRCRWRPRRMAIQRCGQLQEPEGQLHASTAANLDCNHSRWMPWSGRLPPSCTHWAPFRWWGPGTQTVSAVPAACQPCRPTLFDCAAVFATLQPQATRQQMLEPTNLHGLLTSVSTEILYFPRRSERRRLVRIP